MARYVDYCSAVASTQIESVCVNGGACDGTERGIWGTEWELGILLLVSALLGLYLVLISYALVLRWVRFFITGFGIVGCRREIASVGGHSLNRL